MALTISADTLATTRFDDTKGVSKKSHNFDTFTKQFQKTPQQKAADSKKAIEIYQKQASPYFESSLFTMMFSKRETEQLKVFCIACIEGIGYFNLE